jgi:hypothetical protein
VKYSEEQKDIIIKLKIDLYFAIILFYIDCFGAKVDEEWDHLFCDQNIDCINCDKKFYQMNARLRIARFRLVVEMFNNIVVKLGAHIDGGIRERGVFAIIMNTRNIGSTGREWPHIFMQAPPVVTIHLVRVNVNNLNENYMKQILLSIGFECETFFALK